MKHLIVLISCLIYVTGISAQTAIKKSNDKKEAAQSSLLINDELEYQAYIANMMDEITNNDKRLASMMLKLTSEKNLNKKLEKKINKVIKRIIILEEYNHELKNDLQDFIDYGEGDWTLFRKEFNSELSDLAIDMNILQMLIYKEFVA